MSELLSSVLQSEVSFQTGVFGVVLVLFAYLIAKFLAPKTRRSSDIIPLSLPKECHFILGHASLLGSGILQALHKLCVACQTKDGLSRFYLMNVECIGILKPEHVQIALNSGNYRRPIPIIHSHFDRLLGAKSLVTLMKDEWSSMRKIVVRSFSLNYLRASCIDIGAVSHDFVNSLCKLDGQVVDMWPATKVRAAAATLPPPSVALLRGSDPCRHSAAPWTSSDERLSATISHAANCFAPRP